MSSALTNWPALVAAIALVLVLAENVLGVTGTVLFPGLEDPED
jgi:uncharacterized membrane protein